MLTAKNVQSCGSIVLGNVAADAVAVGPSHVMCMLLCMCVGVTVAANAVAGGAGAVYVAATCVVDVCYGCRC